MAQIIFQLAPDVKIEEVNQITQTKRGDKGFGSTDIYSASIETLEKFHKRPKGTHYLGTKAAKALAYLGGSDREQINVIIDSGSTITLIAPKTLKLMKNPPSPKKGQDI